MDTLTVRIGLLLKLTDDQKAEAVLAIKDDPELRTILSNIAPDQQGFFEATIIRHLQNLQALQGLQAQRHGPDPFEEFTKQSEKLRSISRSSDTGTVVLGPADEAKERDLFLGHIKKGTGVEVLNKPTSALLPLDNLALAAVRWFALREIDASTLDLTVLVSTIVKRKGESAEEIKYHPALLALYQAAARGQPRVQFSREDQSTGNKAREDLRCTITEADGTYSTTSPSENKVDWEPSTTKEDTGVVPNADSIGKVYKCILSHVAKKTIIIGTVSSKFELLWIVRFKFQMLDEKKRYPEQLWLVPNVDERLLKLGDSPQSQQTLATLLQSVLEPPSGFLKLTRFVSSIAADNNIPVAALELVCGSLSGDTIDSPLSQSGSLELDNLKAISAPHSVVLVPETNEPELGLRVVKVSKEADIKHELSIHEEVDDHPCRFLRKANVALSGQVLEALMALHSKKVCHGDVKLSNVLLTYNQDRNLREARLNDFDLSFLQSNPKRGPHGTPQYMSPSVRAGNEYTKEDDLFSLALTFAHLRRIRVGDPSSDKGKVELVRRLCGSHQVYAQALGHLVRDAPAGQNLSAPPPNRGHQMTVLPSRNRIDV